MLTSIQHPQYNLKLLNNQYNLLRAQLALYLTCLGVVVEPRAVERVPLRHPVLHEEPHLGREVSGHGAVLRTRHLRHAAAAPGQRGQRGGGELTANISNMMTAVSKHLDWLYLFFCSFLNRLMLFFSSLVID